MIGKHERQQAIRKLVERDEVRSQTALRGALLEKRIDVDQSTLSRDLRELGIRKTGGRYRAEPRRGGDRAPAAIDYSPVVRRWVTCGPHLIVLRTNIGQAQPVGIAIDEANDAAIAGTIAGDDTVMIATRSRRQQVVALRRLEEWFGDKQT